VLILRERLMRPVGWKSKRRPYFVRETPQNEAKRRKMVKGESAGQFSFRLVGESSRSSSHG
jgi:hypothetical protein